MSYCCLRTREKSGLIGEDEEGPLEENLAQAGEMAQQVRRIAASPGNLSLSLKTHMVASEN